MDSTQRGNCQLANELSKIIGAPWRSVTTQKPVTECRRCLHAAARMCVHGCIPGDNFFQSQRIGQKWIAIFSKSIAQQFSISMCFERENRRRDSVQIFFNHYAKINQREFKYGKV